MIGWLYRQLRLIRKALKGRADNPRGLAWAFALGVLLGLMPKGNLIAAVIVVVILGSKVNGGIAMITAALVSFTALIIDPLLHQIGLTVLTHQSLYPIWHKLYQWPLAPWSNFNHTLVMGGLVLGLILLYPSYRFSYFYFARNESADDEGRDGELRTSNVQHRTMHEAA
jgi:uncharacterized protein (TIGR03546 family)